MKNKKILVCGLIILILIVFLIVFKNKIQRIFYPKLHEEFVSMYSDEYGVDENLVFAVIKAESNFQEDAVSHKDALGLMQIMKETAEDVARKYNIEIDFNNSEREILNVQNNIKIGTKYLAVLLEKYKNIEYIFVNYFIAENDEGKYGIITSNGKEAIEFKYSLLQKIKGKKILQAINSETKATDFYNSSLKIILSAKDAQIDNKEGYIKVTSNGNIYYFDEDGNKLDENSEIITKKDLLAEPEKIGIYKKVQFTLENVYYVKE